MKLNILGTEYTVVFDVLEENMPIDADGCVDQSVKLIKIAKMEQERNSLMDLESYKKKVLRHEIIHAFLYESGLWNNSHETTAWATDEEIVDWFAIQSPKIIEVFKAAECL